MPKRSKQRVRRHKSKLYGGKKWYEDWFTKTDPPKDEVVVYSGDQYDTVARVFNTLLQENALQVGDPWRNLAEQSTRLTTRAENASWDDDEYSETKAFLTPYVNLLFTNSNGFVDKITSVVFQNTQNKERTEKILKNVSTDIWGPDVDAIGAQAQTGVLKRFQKFLDTTKYAQDNLVQGRYAFKNTVCTDSIQKARDVMKPAGGPLSDDQEKALDNMKYILNRDPICAVSSPGKIAYNPTSLASDAEILDIYDAIAATEGYANEDSEFTKHKFDREWRAEMFGTRDPRLPLLANRLKDGDSFADLLSTQEDIGNVFENFSESQVEKARVEGFNQDYEEDEAALFKEVHEFLPTLSNLFDEAGSEMIQIYKKEDKYKDVTDPEASVTKVQQQLLKKIVAATLEKYKNDFPDNAIGDSSRYKTCQYYAEEKNPFDITACPIKTRYYLLLNEILTAYRVYVKTIAGKKPNFLQAFLKKIEANVPGVKEAVEKAKGLFQKVVSAATPVIVQNVTKPDVLKDTKNQVQTSESAFDYFLKRVAEFIDKLNGTVLGSLSDSAETTVEDLEASDETGASLFNDIIETSADGTETTVTNKNPCEVPIYFEAQDSEASCGRHALNNFLQEQQFDFSLKKEFTYVTPDGTVQIPPVDDMYNLHDICEQFGDVIIQKQGFSEKPEEYKCREDENYNWDPTMSFALYLTGFDIVQMFGKDLYDLLFKNLFTSESIGAFINLGQRHWVSLRKIESSKGTCYAYFNSTSPDKKAHINKDLNAFVQYVKVVVPKSSFEGAYTIKQVKKTPRDIVEFVQQKLNSISGGSIIAGGRVRKNRYI